jgi:DNA helicase-2/ATP-dependent DNA helicase PcrA
VGLAEKLAAREEDPPRIKFLTFTRAATLELAKKISASTNTQLPRPSTIHSFAISLVLANPGSATFPQPLRIPDPYEYRELIRPDLAARASVGLRRLDQLVAEMAAKWESLVPQELPAITPAERARFMGTWDVHRRVFGYTLLDELPDLARCALRDHEDLQAVEYDLLITDEYQDLNACDLELLRRLADRGASILAIGDDDQSIYSFRKAHPQGIRRFCEDYAGAIDYPLSVCHRSARRIVEWANFVIEGDAGRLPRPPACAKADAPDGDVALLRFLSERAEAKGVADLIEWLRGTKEVPPQEILILSRTDRSGTFTRMIRDELTQRGIPVSDTTELATLLQDPANRRALSLLRLLTTRVDSLAWWTLIRLTRGLGPIFEHTLFDKALASGATFGEAFCSAAEAGFGGFRASARVRAVELWLETTTMLDGIVLPEGEETSWGAWIVELIARGRIPAVSPALAELLQEVDSVVAEGERLERFLSQIQPVGRDLLQARSEGVRFMTITGSKGLTATAAIVVGVENDLIPRPDEDLAEERRLLYVAMTRSCKHLFLTWANRRRGPTARAGRANLGRRQPSLFLRGGPVGSEDGSLYARGLTQ